MASVAVETVPSAGTAVTLGIRPEHVRLGTAGETEGHVGAARLVEMLGSDTFVHLKEGEETLVVRDSKARRIRQGEAVAVSFPHEACYLFDATGQRISRDPTFATL
jgi:multiple sugar transport system ATP-binding protein